MQGAFFQGVCYPDTNQAIAQFAGNFPQVVNGTMQQYWGTEVVVDRDFQYSVAWFDDQGQFHYQTGLSANFQPCDLPDDLITSVGGIEFSGTYILFTLIFIVAMMGFRAGFRP